MTETRPIGRPRGWFTPDPVITVRGRWYWLDENGSLTVLATWEEE